MEGGEEEASPAQVYVYNLVLAEQDGKSKAVVVPGEWDDTLLEGKGGYTSTVHDLKPGAEYCAHVEVVCKIHGPTKGASEKLSMPPTCPQIPAPPSVNGKGKTWIKLRWVAPNGELPSGIPALRHCTQNPVLAPRSLPKPSSDPPNRTLMPLSG